MVAKEGNISLEYKINPCKISNLLYRLHQPLCPGSLVIMSMVSNQTSQDK